MQKIDTKECKYFKGILFHKEYLDLKTAAQEAERITELFPSGEKLAKKKKTQYC
jgi:hypothetical protein